MDKKICMAKKKPPESIQIGGSLTGGNRGPP